MSVSIILFAMTTFFVAAFLKGLSGMGFATICLAVMAMALDVKLAIALVILPSLSSNLLVMYEAGRFREAVARFWVMIVCALPGLGLGLWLLRTTGSEVPRGVLGGMLLLYGLWGLFGLRGAGGDIPFPRGVWFQAPVGLLNGLVNGLTGSQVMPVLPYLVSLRLDKDLFVQTINLSFTVSSVVMLFGLGRLGVLTVSTAAWSLLGIVPVALGIRLGSRLRRRFSEEAFRRVIMVMLTVFGVALMGRALS